MGEIFGRVEAAASIAVPSDDDDKYSRGVVGFVTGSARYPGAAVLGVEAALRTGVGMVRYLGPGRAGCRRGCSVPGRTRGSSMS